MKKKLTILFVTIIVCLFWAAGSASAVEGQYGRQLEQSDERVDR